MFRNRDRVKVRAWVVVAAVAATALASFAPEYAGGPVASAATSKVVKPVADTYVSSADRDTNFGTKYVLAAQAESSSTPEMVSYIKFDVSGLQSPPAGVQLQLYSYAASATGLQVWTSNDSWTETGLTYSNAPSRSTSMVGAIPSISTNAWASLDVSNIVNGNGTYVFVVTTTATAKKQMASRESGASSPQLVIDTSAAGNAIRATAGSGQSAAVGAAFATGMVATVQDSSGGAVPNAAVTFTAPSSGASGTFAGGSQAVSVSTDGSGAATAPAFTANSIAGTYSVTASTATAPSPASYSLTNIAQPSPSPSSGSPTPSASGTSSSPPPPTSSTVTVVPNADSYVRSDQPDTNFGSKYVLASEAGSATTPTITSYLRFDVNKLTAPVTGASLQLYSYATSSQGIRIGSAVNDWVESTITDNNAPSLGATVASVPSIALDHWALADVTSAVNGDGTYTFAITTTRTANNQFGSREGGNPPKLIVTTDSGSPSPSVSPTPSSSATPTTSPTPTPSSTATSGSPTPTATPSPTASSSSPVTGVAVTVSGGSPQTATVGSAFAAPLVATVSDSSGPMVGVNVTFTAPTSGPTALFAGGSATATVTTGVDGVATSPQVTAGSAAGSYAVVATTSGASHDASFALTNRDPTIVAAGDIACPAGKTPTATSCQQVATSDLAIGLKPDAVLPLGDDQYELGSLSDFQSMYNPSWGRLNDISRPIPGNHEYGYIGSSVQPTGGEGYFTYFGPRAHPLQPNCTINCTSWYSYNIGKWHLIALDSQCGVVGGCNPGNPQYKWLLSDLNANAGMQCTLAYWHIPVFSSSQDHQPDMQAIYALLYNKGADVVLTGHAHFYERFGPQDASGTADPARGISQFVVGSGGRSFFSIRATPSANSEARIANTFGVLKMALSDGGYSWQFVPSSGTAADSGSAVCH